MTNDTPTFTMEEFQSELASLCVIAANAELLLNEVDAYSREAILVREVRDGLANLGLATIAPSLPEPLLKNAKAREAVELLFEMEYTADEVREAMMQLDIEESA